MCLSHRTYLLIDDRSSKRPRGTVEARHPTVEARRVVPDSLESPYVHNSLLDIDELMK